MLCSKTPEPQLVGLKQACLALPPAPPRSESSADPRALYRWSESFSSVLITSRRYFSGDLDQFIVFLVFAIGELSRRAEGRGAKGLNALSVADITLIPRETTRRKLRDLAASGHVRCGEDGLWYIEESQGMDLLIRHVSGLLESGARLQSVKAA